ncbi:MAG: carboxypeptidase-like regulatory domain-containing protein [Thermoanaerobaculia bacterium]
MKRLSATAAVMLMLFGAGGGRAEVRLSDVIEILGRVTESQRPVDEALVIAFNLSNSYIVQTFTEPGGRFELPPLPSGVYRIIAVKQGFAPAVATVTPSIHSGRELTLQLREAKSLTDSDRNAIWHVRRAIPSDVLRELGIVDESFGTVAIATEAPDRFSGEMVSMAGVAQSGTAAGYAGTEVGVRGAFGDGWLVDVSGAIRTFDEGAPHEGGEWMAEATGLTMALRSAHSSSYELASVRNSWALGAESGMPSMADFESHRFGFSRPNTNVQVRYVAYENLFGPRAGGSEMFELQAEQNLHRTERSEIGVALRVGQESFIGQSADVPFLSADLRTRGSYELTPALVVKYGLNSRLTDYGTEWQPESGLLIRFTPASSILLSGSYKVQDLDLPTAHPSIIFLDQTWSLAPKYSYAIGFTSGTSEVSRFTAGASIAEIDSVLRLVFDESFQDFWDALHFAPGDVYQTMNVGLQKQLGESVALDLAAQAGEASGTLPAKADKHFMTGSLRTVYIPSGTGVHLAWRYIEQPTELTGGPPQESERFNLRLAQSLGLPLGLRVLIGVDLARARNSWVLADGPSSEEGYQRRIVGGLSLAF